MSRKCRPKHKQDAAVFCWFSLQWASLKNCSNGSYKLKKIKEEQCKAHSTKRIHCGCDILSVSLPNDQEEPKKERQTWIQLVNQLKEGSRTKLFEPGKDSRICSTHFKDIYLLSTSKLNDKPNNFGYWIPITLLLYLCTSSHSFYDIFVFVLLFS